jgi:hypothetical protein
MKPSAPSEYTVSEGVNVGRIRSWLTFDDIVVAPFDSHIGDADELKGGVVMLLSEEVSEPGRLLDIADCSSDIVPAGKQLVNDVAANKAIDTGDEDERARFNGECGHCGSEGQMVK